MNENTDFLTFQWKVGLSFPKREAFKKAIAKFVVTNGRNLIYIVNNKNMQQRLRVKCLKWCPFRLYSSWDSRGAYFIVKSVDSEHTCNRNREANKQMKSTWLVEQFLEVFKARPHWLANEIVKTIRRAYRVSIKKPLAYKVKYYAHRMLHGSMQEHYSKLGRYLESLKISCLKTYLLLETNPYKKTFLPVFLRLFVCFYGLKKGWLEGCRKLICVDACFLKTFLGGQLLAIVERDSNGHIYPIAWIVMEAKNINYWVWFFIEL